MGEIIKNLGGDRLGSGNKNNIRLHNYERSTHNLSKRWKSSMAAGVLYPCYTNIALNGDTFDIDLDAACRTIPTQGPLFDTFKLQVDVYSVPLRLYNGILHNNPVDIGMKMEQIKFPVQYIASDERYMKWMAQDIKTSQINPSCLLHYLGLSGIYAPKDIDEWQNNIHGIGRYINATPILAYYDIFKNYYANKQEEKAYVIDNEILSEESDQMTYIGYTPQAYPIANYLPAYAYQYIKIEYEEDETWTQPITFNKGQILKIVTDTNIWNIELINGNVTNTLQEYIDNGLMHILSYVESQQTYYVQILEGLTLSGSDSVGSYLTWKTYLKDFALKNIDEMRQSILSNSEMNVAYDLHTLNKYPYKCLEDYSEYDGTYRAYHITQPMQGLCVKTYQSDMFNNWVQTEWIDGENGINAITAIDTSSGTFTLDTLNLSQKVYNMLNRIAVSGGTYQDWQEAVYSEKAIRHAETPIYCGGMSSEVVFEEIISNTNVTNTNTGSNEPMGTLGGRGKLNGIKYGKLHIKVNEPSIIMAIASLTPRVTYTQGNKWYLTDLQSYNDLHKPALDGIGFQDLIGEQMAWWASTCSHKVGDPTQGRIERLAVGKIPAWMNYMTDVDEAHGDFALTNGKGYMILNRDYGCNWDGFTMEVTDFTTYIDPAKYNYAFAYSDTSAQNFWVQVNLDIKARRKMSAKQIPNL